MDWLNKLKEYAPDIAAAIVSGGATLPALAVKAVRDAVGDESITTESALANFVEAANPDTMLKVKQANNSFMIRMRELDVELDQAEIKDKQNARSAHKDSVMPALICVLLTMIVGFGGYLLFTLNIPDGNREIAYLLFGSLMAKWGDSIAYWVGTTRSSNQKTLMMTMRGSK